MNRKMFKNKYENADSMSFLPLIICIAAGLLLIAINIMVINFAPENATILTFIQSTTTDAYFLLFGVFISGGCKDPKRFLRPGFVWVFAAILVGFFATKRITSFMLSPITLLFSEIGQLLELVIVYALMGVVVCFGAKLFDPDARILSRSFFRIIFIGLGVAATIKIVSFFIFQSVWYQNLYTGNDTLVKYFSVLSIARINSFVAEILMPTVPLLYGVAIWINRNKLNMYY